MEPAAQLAEFLGMPVDLLQPCLVQPLPKPDLDFATNSLNSELPQLYSGLLRICNGFTLFPDHPYGPISFWGTSDLLADAKFDDDIVKQSITRGFCPIYGRTPHLTSIRISDQSIIATDWEVADNEPQGWCRPVAPSMSELVQTLLKVYDADPATDWCQTYVSHGSRYDLPPQ